MAKMNKKILKPLVWIMTRVLSMVPVLRNVIKGIEGDTEVTKLEKLGEYEKARRLRANILNKYPLRYLGPLWRSEGVDQLYKLKNYKKALIAFENAISCIESESYLSAMQYGVTQPTEVYYGAAVAATQIEDKKKAGVYFTNFKKLIERIGCKDHYQNQYNWLKNCIEAENNQTDIND